MKLLPLPRGIASLQKCYLPMKDFDELGALCNKYVAIKFKTGCCIVKLNFLTHLHPNNFLVNAAVCSSINLSTNIFREELDTSHIIPYDGLCEAKTANISIVFRDLEKLVAWKNNSSNVLVDILKLYIVAHGTYIFLNDVVDYLDLGMVYIVINHVCGRRNDSRAAYKFESNTNIIIHSELTEKMVQSRSSVYCGGMKKPFQRLVDIVNHHRLLKSSFTNRNALLLGPSGCGKKSLVKRVAKHCTALVIEVDGCEILCPNNARGRPGEVEANIQHTFDLIKVFCEQLNSFKFESKLTKSKTNRLKSTKDWFDTYPIVVLLLSHIELMCPNRSKRADSKTSQLLAAMDSLQHLNNLIIFATSSAVDEVDQAIRRPGRLDQEVYIGVPSEVERAEIIKELLLEMSAVPGGDVEQLSRAAASLTPGRVAADLCLLCRQVQWMRIQRKCTDPSEQEGDCWLRDFALCTTQLPVSSLLGSPGTVINGPSDGPPLSSISGLQRVKERLVISVREPLLHAEAFRRLGIRPPRGVLLYGPPGCAKTSLARALASAPASGHAAITFLSLSAAQLFSPFVGESEKTVLEIFRRARAGAPSIVFIDELDALFGSRDGMHKGGVQERVLAALLMEMDGVGHRMIAGSPPAPEHQVLVAKEGQPEMSAPASRHPGASEPYSLVTVIAATNRPDLIDDAVLRPGRLDQLIYVPPPDEDARVAILRQYTERMSIGDKAAPLLRSLAHRTDLYSGADLKNLCKEAALKAMSEDGFAVQHVKEQHFETALKSLQSSLTSDMIASYQKFYDNKFSS